MELCETCRRSEAKTRIIVIGDMVPMAKTEIRWCETCGKDEALLRTELFHNPKIRALSV